MDKTINKYLVALFGAITMLLSFSSCTDQDDVDISYEQKIGISAANIFANYEPYKTIDFDMSKDGWKLHLTALVYNDNGELVDRSEKTCSTLNESLEYSPSLIPGKYTVVCIADFRGGLGGDNYKFWNLEDEGNLATISITENEIYYPVVFETLGLDVQNIKVTDKTGFINSDIKPITALVQILSSDKDYTGWGVDGYSRYSVLAEDYSINAIKAKNNVRLENGVPVYKYSEQESDYTLSVSKVHDKWSDKLEYTDNQYRALLPEDNKAFTFHIQKRDIPQEYYDTLIQLCGDFDEDGQSNILPKLESNKQYIVNMVLDAMQLKVMEKTEDYKHEVYTQSLVNSYKDELMTNLINTNYVNLLGKDDKIITSYMGVEPYDYGKTTSLYLAYYYPKALHFENWTTIAYLNSDYSKCVDIQLVLPSMSDEEYSRIQSLLRDKYQEETWHDHYDGVTTFVYIEPNKSSDDSRYRVVLQRVYASSMKRYFYFLHFILRSKFY